MVWYTEASGRTQTGWLQLRKSDLSMRRKEYHPQPSERSQFWRNSITQMWSSMSLCLQRSWKNRTWQFVPIHHTYNLHLISMIQHIRMNGHVAFNSAIVVQPLMLLPFAVPWVARDFMQAWGSHVWQQTALPGLWISWTRFEAIHGHNPNLNAGQESDQGKWALQLVTEFAT